MTEKKENGKKEANVLKDRRKDRRKERSELILRRKNRN